jgi:DNA-binding beta-propeller fold protein YncE
MTHPLAVLGATPPPLCPARHQQATGRPTLPRIYTGRELNSIAITPDGTTAYVTRDRTRNGADIPGKVIPIDTSANTAGPSILVGMQPTVIAITP